MSKGQQIPPRFSWLKPDIIVPFILLIIVVVFAVWDGRHNNNSASNSSFSAPAGWNEYKATKYGFKFSYPTSWGTPQVTADKGKSGNHYQIGFTPDPKSKSANKNLSVLIGMDSSDYTSATCSSSACQGPNAALSSKTVQNNLKFGASTFIKRDATSYAFLSSTPDSSFLTDVQIVNLTQVKASAASAIYRLQSATNCPPGKLAPISSKSCVTQASYSDINQVLKSLQDL
jgi:hypothetical protein